MCHGSGKAERKGEAGLQNQLCKPPVDLPWDKWDVPKGGSSGGMEADVLWAPVEPSRGEQSTSPPLSPAPRGFAAIQMCRRAQQCWEAGIEPQKVVWMGMLAPGSRMCYGRSRGNTKWGGSRRAPSALS